MINRRGFLARLIAAPVVALTVLRAPLRERWIDDLISFKQAETGLSIRYVQQYDIAAGPITRMDVIYGVANILPEYAIRVYEYPWWHIRRWL